MARDSGTRNQGDGAHSKGSEDVRGAHRCPTFHLGVKGMSESNLNQFNNCIARMEVECLKHPGASTIGSQLQDEDCSHGWQILATQP